MVILERIRWKNLLSTGGLFTEIDLSKPNNTLIIGKNGSGKSTFLDALTFSLFGKSFRNINKPTLVNSINGKDCVIELEFSVGLKKYKIVRGLKPNIFEIYVDGKMLDQDAATKDYQGYLEKHIIKMDFKSFTQIVILGSASFTPFMQLSTNDRRGIIEDLLDIEIFSKMNIIAKTKLQTNKENFEKARFEITLLVDQEKVLNETCSNLRQDVTNKKNIIELDILEKKNFLAYSDVQLMELLKEISSFEGMITNYDSLKDTETKLLVLKEQIKSNHDHHVTDVNFYSKHDHCPKCKQEIDSAFKTEAITKSNSSLESLDKGLSDINSKIVVVKTQIKDKDSIKKSIVSVKENMNKVIIKKEHLISDIARLEKEMVGLNNTTGSLSVSEDKLVLVRKDIESRETIKDTLLKERLLLDTAVQLLKDGGIKTKIIKQYLPIINKQINKYLQAMDFFVNFNLDENFQETIKSRNRDIFSYSNFSEGEKQKIDLALLFAWRTIAKMKNSINTNLLILDEVFDSSLDSTGVDLLFPIIQSFTDKMNVFVISHKEQMVDRFERTIKFDKFKDFSRIVETE